VFTAEAVLEGIGDSVFVVGLDGCLQLLNTASEQLFGDGRHAWLGRSVLDVVHPDDVGALRHALALLGEGGATPLLSLRVRDTNQEWRRFEGAAIGNAHSAEVQGLICVAQDITERRIREVASGDTSTFHQLVEVSPAMLALVDPDGVVTRVSDSLLRHFELDRAAVEGRPLACLAPLDDGEAIVRAIERMRSHHQREVVHRSLPVGRPIPARLEMVNFIDDSLVSGIVVTIDDLTDLRAALAQAERAALYDQLTGLMNRQALLIELQRRLGLNEPFAALFINLDYFRPVNDLYGYQAGDELLVQVAQRLERSIRPHDLVARVGGDEFVILVAGVDAATAVGLVEQLEMAVSAPYELSSGSVRIGASAGIAVAEPDSTTVTLLADADASMREVKAQRRGLARVSVFSRRTTSMERMQLVEECREGLTKNEFIAHF
jgi:diguanylate cyclase (GGDEF)-like protein/PAS domain S-box-containing protein